MKNYSTKEYHDIFNKIPNHELFKICDEVSGKVRTANKWDLLDWMNALDIMTAGENSPCPVDENSIEAWAICEESANYFYEHFGK